MAARRRTEEEIIMVLREAEKGDLSTPEICRKHEISEASFYKWRKRYGGVDKPEIKRLRELEKENNDLKKALGEHVIVINALKEVQKKRGWD